MDTRDLKAALRTTLMEKQALVRDYQTFAQQINDPEVAKLYYHFAEAEALHATQIKEQLEKMQ